MEKGNRHYGAGAWFRIDEYPERQVKRIVRCLDVNDDSDEMPIEEYGDECDMCWFKYPHSVNLHNHMVERRNAGT